MTPDAGASTRSPTTSTSSSRSRPVAWARGRGTRSPTTCSGTTPWRRATACRRASSTAPSSRSSTGSTPTTARPRSRPSSTRRSRASRLAFEHRVLWPDGTVHWIEARGRAVMSDDGDFIGMVGIGLDIDDRKQFERHAPRRRAAHAARGRAADRTHRELAVGPRRNEVTLSTEMRRQLDIDRPLTGADLRRLIEERAASRRHAARARDAEPLHPAGAAVLVRAPDRRAQRDPPRGAPRRGAARRRGRGRRAPGDHPGRHRPPARRRRRCSPPASGSCASAAPSTCSTRRSSVPSSRQCRAWRSRRATCRPRWRPTSAVTGTTPSRSRTAGPCSWSGDVSGHGIRAARLMAKLRHTIRGFAVVEPRPDRVIESLDRFLAHFSTEEEFATVQVAALDHRTGEVELVSAGHPAPVIVSRRRRPVRRRDEHPRARRDVEPDGHEHPPLRARARHRAALLHRRARRTARRRPGLTGRRLHTRHRALAGRHRRHRRRGVRRGARALPRRRRTARTTCACSWRCAASAELAARPGSAAGSSAVRRRRARAPR